MDSLTVSSANETLPIILDDLKTHLRITHSDDDDYITDLAWMAYAWIESEADITIGATEYTLKQSCFEPVIHIPKPPLASIQGVTYFDIDNISQTLVDGTDFYTMTPDKQEAYLAPATSWPSVHSRPDAVTIVFTAGNTSPPKQVLHLIRLLVGSAYENREAEVAGVATNVIKLGVDRLMNQIRNVRYR